MCIFLGNVYAHRNKSVLSISDLASIGKHPSDVLQNLSVKKYAQYSKERKIADCRREKEDKRYEQRVRFISYLSSFC